MLQLCANANLSGRGPSILLTQTRTTLFLLCTKSYIVWRKIGVWCSFYWKFIKRKSLKLLGTSRSFRLCYLKIGNLLVNRLHRGDVARTGPVFVQQTPTASTKVVYSFGHSPFLTERDGNRDNGCWSLSNRDKRDVFLCPAERNISIILNLCLTSQAMRFEERSWILSFSLGLLLRIHPLWWKYPHDP